MSKESEQPLSAIAALKARQNVVLQHDVSVRAPQVDHTPATSQLPQSPNVVYSAASKRLLKRKRRRNTLSSVPDACLEVQPPLAHQENAGSFPPDALANTSVNTDSYHHTHGDNNSDLDDSYVEEGDRARYSSSDFDFQSEPTLEEQRPQPKGLANEPVNNRLSTFIPSPETVLKSTTREWSIRLTDRDTVTFIGQYDLWVRKGTIKILGAMIHASPKLYRVYAPSTHALPSIQHIRDPFGPVDQPAEIDIFSCWTRIRRLRRVSRKFRRIWNQGGNNGSKLAVPENPATRSFRFLKESWDDLQKRPLTPVSIVLEWQSLIAEIVDTNSQLPKVILICGPKGAGKSTLSRLLTNEYLSRPSLSSGVMFLDLDPGQPEYSPPGNISLLHIKDFNLGPPFTHPIIPDDSENRLIRCHHVGNITPRDDPYHYMHCVRDLYSHYRHILADKSRTPLIINSCGWIQGGGLDMLEEFIKNMLPTDVIYMSDKGPEEVVQVLNTATNRSGSLYHTLPSRPFEGSQRTAADLRTMQTLSYFHLDDPDEALLRWNATSIHAIRPKELYYTGSEQSIFGIMILGEEMDHRFLADLINGSVLGLVAIEDESALPSDALMEDYNITDTSCGGVDLMHINSDPPKNLDDYLLSVDSPVFEEQPLFTAHEPSTTTSMAPLKTRQVPSGQQSPNAAVRRTEEGLPYLFMGHGVNTPLDPSKTRCIGQVFIRSIAKKSHALEILTPIPTSTLSAYHEQGIKLVLVRGGLDMPTWAYEEECIAALTADKERHRWRRYRDQGAVEDSEGYGGSEHEEDFDVEAWAEQAPWVSVAPRERHRRDRVWKVRRNLGKGGGGEP